MQGFVLVNIGPLEIRVRSQAKMASQRHDYGFLPYLHEYLSAIPHLCLKIEYFLAL